MKQVRARLIFASLTALFLASSLLIAQAPRVKRAQAFGPHRPPMQQALGPRGAEGRWWNNLRMIEQLKLTDDQRKSMDQIFYDHRAKLIDLQANLQRAELAMEPLMAADQPDQKALESQTDKIVSARGELERANAHFLLDIRMKLTPDQWKQLRQMRADRMPQPGQGPGPMMRQWRDRQGGPQTMPPPGATQPTPPNPPSGPGGAGMDQ